jgi:peptide deformylase
VIRPVVRFPASILKLPTAEISPGDFARELTTDLLDTMRASPACVGLAANQIGVGARAFVLDVSAHPKATDPHGPIILINPLIVEREGSTLMREGCMSVPDFTGNVHRAERVVVRGLGPDGDERRYECIGFEARAVQHEVDHLDGMLFLDRIESIATDLFRRKRYSPPGR